MRRRSNADSNGGWTRGGVLRAALGTGAVLAGGAGLGAATGGGAAAASSERETEVLNLFLKLEYAQEAFYGAATRSGRLRGPLLEYARAAAEQETAHAALLRRRLGTRADARPQSDPAGLVESAEAFTRAAVALEEDVVGVYVGQAPNLPDSSLVPVATLVSVEARQAAWIRALADTIPAPRAADPARDAEKVLADLRDKGLLA